jgi:hypothetical protein
VRSVGAESELVPSLSVEHGRSKIVYLCVWSGDTLPTPPPADTPDTATDSQDDPADGYGQPSGRWLAVARISTLWVNVSATCLAVAPDL